MKLRTLIEFNDYKEKVRRKVGDEFIASQARYEEIIEAYKEPLVEVVEEPKKKPAPKKAAKK